jgi:hypothetical protein
LALVALVEFYLTKAVMEATVFLELLLQLAVVVVEVVQTIVTVRLVVHLEDRLLSLVQRLGFLLLV